MNNQYTIGCQLLNYDLPPLLVPFISSSFQKLYYDLKINDSFLDKKLPFVISFGYTYGTLIHELCHPADDYTAKKQTGIINSLFNTGISLFDYIVDGFPNRRDLIFKITETQLLKNIDDPTRPSKLSINTLEKISPREYFLISIIQSFTYHCKELYRIHDNTELWNKFSNMISGIYNAEKLSCYLQENNIEMSKSKLLHIIESKSSRPFLIPYFISQFPLQLKQKEQKNRIKKVCSKIGKIFWVIDDLSDIVNDLQTNSPNYIGINTHKIHNNFKNYDIRSFLKSLDPHLEYFIQLVNSLISELDSTVYNNSKLSLFVKSYIVYWLKGVQYKF